MISELVTYLRLGFGHILDLQGYDHILFVLALVAGEAHRIKRLVWLVTAFTLGHSATLALATLGLVRADPGWIEFLIPLTIVLTSAFNLRPAADSSTRSRDSIKYILAVGFGLIHGLGFSNFLRAALGAEEAITVPLLGFNLGVEAGQLLIVAIALTAANLVTRWTRLDQRQWLLVVSGLTGLVALIMMVSRWPF